MFINYIVQPDVNTADSSIVHVSSKLNFKYGHTQRVIITRMNFCKHWKTYVTYIAPSIASGQAVFSTICSDVVYGNKTIQFGSVVLIFTVRNFSVLKVSVCVV